ncbi:MAG TPA: Hsp33 family molecular chaperone [Thermopetrobacter sp.]|nr:Hsp33 family molecular chaperone [Thermopetrobacter sp.]
MNGSHAPHVRPARVEMEDDIVLPFTVDALDVRGRVARLGEAVDAAIRQHDYPPPVSRLLAEIMSLAALIGTSLKFDGRLIVQAETDGPLRLLVADFATPGDVRGLARFDEKVARARMEKGGADAEPAALLGEGRLVFTIDQGEHMRRYQGVVALKGDLARAAEEYFARSEQIPTRLRLAAGEVRDGGGARWRAGALMIQHMPPAGGDADEERRRADAWRHAAALADTVEDHELLDPRLSPERLLYRLFHEVGVRVFDPLRIRWRCTCSRERLAAMLKAMPAEDRAHLVRDGRIVARCEFCSAEYVFDPAELETGEADESA